MAGARRWVWIGGAIGAMAVSGALVAVLNEHDNGEGGGTGGAGEAGDSADETVPEPGQTHWRYTYPESYAGPVWITVEAPDNRVRQVTITWGAWQRRLVHEDVEPTTYLFNKSPGPTVPIAVDVEPEATVTFGSGTPSPDAEDINAGWTQNR